MISFQNVRNSQSWRATKSLGKVRTEHVKRIARELVEKFPDKFTTDFEVNKRVLESVAEIPTSRLLLLKFQQAGLEIRLQATLLDL